MNSLNYNETKIVDREINNENVNNDENIKPFKYLQENITRDNYLQMPSPNDAYKNFDKIIFSSVYGIAIPNNTTLIKN